MFNKIVLGDCICELKKLPSNIFDLSFADPPFNLGKKYTTSKDEEEENVYIDWSIQWLSEMVRVTKIGGTILVHNIPKWLAKYCCYLNNEAMFRHWIVWDAPTSPMGQSLQPAHYGILYYTKGNSNKIYELRMPHKRCRSKSCNLLLKDYGGKKQTIHPFGPLVSDVWTDIFRCKHKKYKDDHPCQLPIHLMERMILMCTDEGDTVLDPFAGTGTTLIAAKRLGRKYFGIEQSKEYVKICENKLSKQPISNIDNIWISCYLNKIYTAREVDIYKNKTFQDGWKKLFNNWPNTDDERRNLNTCDLEFRNDVKNKIREICGGK